MPLLFLIPLILALIVGYIALNADTEIAYLTSTVSVVGFFASIILAPWQIQLLILLFVMVGAKQLWQRNETKTNLEILEPDLTPPSSSHPNQLNSEDSPWIYRGVSYQKEVPLEQGIDNNKPRKYRGVTWTKDNSSTNLSSQPKNELKYRGNNIIRKPNRSD